MDNTVPNPLDSLIGDKAVAPIFDNASTLQRLFDVVQNLLLRSTINQIKDSDLLVAYSLAYSQIFGGIQEAAFAMLIWCLFYLYVLNSSNIHIKRSINTGLEINLTRSDT